MNPKAKELLQDLNNANFFGGTDFTEEQFNQVFSDPIKRKELLGDLNGAKFFGEVDFTEQQFNDTFFSSTSPEATEPIEAGEQSQDSPNFIDAQAEARVEVSEAETSGYSTDLPDVQTELTVPSFDDINVTQDATEVGEIGDIQRRSFQLEAGHDLTMDEATELEKLVKSNMEGLVKNVSDIDGLDKFEIDTESATYKDLYAQLRDVVGSKIKKEGRGLLLSDVREDSPRIDNKTRAVLEDYIKEFMPKDDTFRGKQDEAFQENLEIATLGMKVAKTRFEEKVAEFEANQSTMSPEERSMAQEEINALYEELQSEAVEFETETGQADVKMAMANVDDSERRFASEFLMGETTSTNPADIIGGELEKILSKNQPKKEAIRNLTDEFGILVDAYMKSDNKTKSMEDLVRLYKSNPSVSQDPKYTDALSKVVAELNLGKHTKDEAAAHIAGIYVEAFREEVEPKTKAGKIGYGIATIPYSIVDDIVELAPELVTVAATVQTRDDERLTEAKVNVGAAFESGNPENISEAIQAFHDTEAAVVSEWMEGAGYVLPLPEAGERTGINNPYKYKLDRSIAQKIRQENRKLNDLTFDGIKKRYENGDISLTQRNIQYVRAATSNAFQSSPSLVQAFIPYVGITTMATSAGGDKYFEGLGELDVDNADLLMGSIFVGMAEGLSGRVERYIGGEAVTAGKKLLTKSAIENGTRVIVRNSQDLIEQSMKNLRKMKVKGVGEGLTKWAFNANAEGMSELLVTMTSNSVDRRMRGLDVEYGTSFLETYMTGAVMGLGMGSITVTSDIVDAMNNPYDMTQEFRAAYDVARQVQKKAKKGQKANLGDRKVVFDNSVDGMAAKIEHIVLRTGVDVATAADALRATMTGDANQQTILDKATGDARQNIAERINDAEYRAIALRELGNLDQDAAINVLESMVQREMNNEIDGRNPNETTGERRSETTDTAAMSNITAENNQNTNVTTVTREGISVNGNPMSNMEVTTYEGSDTAPLTMADGTQAQEVAYISTEFGGFAAHRTQDGRYVISQDGDQTYSDAEAITPLLVRIAQDMEANGTTGGEIKFVVSMIGGTEDATSDLNKAIKAVFGENSGLSEIQENQTIKPESLTSSGQPVTFTEATITIEGGVTTENIASKAKVEFNEISKKDSFDNPSEDVTRPNETLEEYGRRALRTAKANQISELDAADQAEDYWEMNRKSSNSTYQNGMSPSEARDRWEKRQSTKNGLIDHTMTDEQIREKLGNWIDKQIQIIKDRAFAEGMTDEVREDQLRAGAKALKKNKNKIIDSYVRTIRIAIDTQMNTGGKFYFFTDANAARDYDNFWFGGEKREEIGHHSPMRNYIVAYGSRMWDNASMLKEVLDDPLKMQTYFREVVNHELFHSMLDKAFKAMGAGDFNKERIKVELVNQIIEMFEQGKLEYRNQKDRQYFAAFLQSYKGRPTSVIAEEVLVEILPQIMQGKIYFNDTVESKGMQKLLQTILDVVNDLFNTDFTVEGLGFDQLMTRTQEAEAFLTVLSSVYTPEGQGLSSLAMNGALVRVLSNADAVSMAKLKARGFDSSFSDMQAYNRMMADVIANATNFGHSQSMFQPQYIDVAPENRGIHINPLGEVNLRIHEGNLPAEVDNADFAFGEGMDSETPYAGTPSDFGRDALAQERGKYGGFLSDYDLYKQSIKEDDKRIADLLGVDLDPDYNGKLEDFLSSLKDDNLDPDSTSMITSGTATDEIFGYAISLKYRYNRVIYEAMPEGLGISEKTSQDLANAIGAAIRLADAMDTVFLMPTTTDEVIRMQDASYQFNLNGGVGAFNQITNAIMIDGRPVAHSLNPEVAARKITETIYHEMFHAMISVATNGGLVGSKNLTTYLSNQIIDMINSGALKFKDQKAATAFKKFIGDYRSEEQAEEVVVETSSLIFSGQMYFDKYKAGNSLQKLFKQFVDTLNKIFGTNIKLDFNKGTAAAEAFYTLTQMVTASASKSSISQEVFVGGIAKLNEIANNQAPEGFEGIMFQADSRKKLENFVDGVKDPNAGTSFYNKARKTGFVAMSIDKKELQEYGLTKGMPTFLGKTHVVVEATQDQAMELMADLGQSAVYTDKGILTLDGKIYPKGKGGDSITINFGKNNVDIYYTQQAKESLAKVEEVAYSARIAKDAVQGIKQLKSDNEKKRLNKIAAKLMSLGYVNAAKSILTAAEASRALKRYGIQTRIVFDKARKVRKDLAGRTLDINLRDGSPLQVATDMAEMIFINASKSFKNDTASALNSAVELRTLLDILAGTSELTEEQQQQTAKQIISAKNTMLNKVAPNIQISENAAMNSETRDQIFNTAALEMMSYGDTQFEAMVESGMPVGVLDTSKHTKIKDKDYSRPRTVNPAQLEARARDYERAYGLPEGSVNIPMFDHTTLPDDTPIISVPHDRQYSGKVTSPLGDFDFGGSGVAMFHPDRVAAGVVYMSDGQKVDKMIAQAIRIRRMIKETTGVETNNVVVAAVMGQNNWQSNRDTAEFATQMAENYFGESFTKKMPQSFKAAILSDDMIKTTDNDTGEKKLSAVGRMVLELVGKSKSIKDFFKAVEGLSFDDRRKISGRYFLQTTLANDSATGEGAKAKKFFAKLGHALLGLSVDPMWNGIPDKHIFMMYEMDIAATVAGRLKDSPVEHRSYDANVYGKPLGILNNTVFYPQAVSFPTEVMEATKPKADDKIDEIIEAYQKSEGKVSEGAATKGDFENIVRMGREAGNTGVFNSGREIPPPADTESTERLAASNVAVDPNTGVRMRVADQAVAELKGQQLQMMNKVVSQVKKYQEMLNKYDGVIEVYADPESFKQAHIELSEGALQGTYDNNPDYVAAASMRGNKIIVNLVHADTTTLPHEVIHLISRGLLRNNAANRRILSDFIKEVLGNPDQYIESIDFGTSAHLKTFANNYMGRGVGTMMDERFTEFTAFLAMGRVKFKSPEVELTFKQKLMQAFNKFMKKLGIKIQMPIKLADDRVAAQRFIEGLAMSISNYTDVDQATRDAAGEVNVQGDTVQDTELQNMPIDRDRPADQVVDPNKDTQQRLSDELTEGSKVDPPSSETTQIRFSPTQSGRKAAAQQKFDARKAVKIERLKRLIAERKTDAINDLTSSSINATATLTDAEINQIVEILQGEQGEAVASFIVSGDRKARQEGRMFKGDAMMAEILANKLGINLTQARALVVAVTGREFTSPDNSTEAARREDYTKMILNTLNFYETTSTFKWGTLDKIFKKMGLAGYEGLDTLMGDGNALLHRRVKVFANSKRKMLDKQIAYYNSQLDRLTKESSPNLLAIERIGEKLDLALSQRENLQHIIDDVDAYNALDKSKSVAAYQKAEMRKWFHEGGKKSFMARMDAAGFSYAEFNEIMLAQHTEERTVRNEQIINEAIGLTHVKRLAIERKLRQAQDELATAEDSSIIKDQINTLQRQLQGNAERIAELESKLEANRQHAEEVLKPQAKVILDKFKERPESEQKAFRKLFEEMKEEILTKRIEMLYDTGVISKEQRDALKDGSRMSVDQLVRKDKDAKLRKRFDAGKLTYEEYLEEVRKLDEKSIQFEAQRELTDALEKLDRRYEQEKEARKQLDRQLANGTMDAATHERMTAPLLTESEYREQVEFIQDAKRKTVFKFDNFDNYVPMQIDDDAYVNNVIEEAYAEYMGVENMGTTAFDEANKTLGSMFDAFTNDLKIGDDASESLNHLSGIVEATLKASEQTDVRRMQRRLGDFRRSIVGAIRSDKKKSTKTGTGTTIQGIRGNATFGLSEMMDPMTVLLAQFDLAAKISARNEAKNKLVTLIEETNKMLTEDAFVAHNSGVFEFAKIVPTHKMRTASVNNMVEAAVKDAELPDNIATSNQYQMNVYIGGKLHTIVFAESDKGDNLGINAMARALLQDEATDFQSLNGGMFMKLYRGALSYMRAAITTANVFFNTSNLMRDTAESLMNISYIYDTYQKTGKSRASLLKEVSKDMAQMMAYQTKMFAAYNNKTAEKVTFKFPSPDGKGEVEVTMHELLEMARHAGATMSWSLVNTDLLGDGIQAIQDAVKAEIKDAKDHSTFEGRMLQLGKRALFMPINLVKLNDPKKRTIAFKLTQMADALENHNRMAAFMLALKKGLTVDQAAAAARNITVNFEKAGTMLKSAKLPNQTSTESGVKGLLQVVQAAYLFIRPALQGGRKFVQRFNTEKGRTSLAISAALNMAANILTLLSNYDEDEQELKNIYRNEYAVENYFHVPLGKGVGVKVPKPYSPDKPLSTMITRAFGAKYTGDTTADIIADGFMGTAKLMLPLDITRAGSGMFDPTLLQPFMDIKRNSTYSGGVVLRNERDPINSVSDQMMLGTNLFGHHISDKNMFIELSKLGNKAFKPADEGYWSKVLSPQGVEHILGGYFLDKGILSPVNKGIKAFSKDHLTQLQQDNSLSEGRIRAIQIGKALKYIEFDAGKVAMAHNFWNATSTNVTQKAGTHQQLEEKIIKLQSIEESFIASMEIGRIDNDKAVTLYKRRITNWFKANSGREGITEGLFMKVAPRAYAFTSTTDLNQKAVQRILDEEQFLSMKRIEGLKASGRFQKETPQRQAEMIMEAQMYEAMVRKEVMQRDVEDLKRAANMGRINAWWEDILGIDDN